MPTNIDQNASWREKSEAKKASVLQGVPTAFLHQELTCSYSDARSVHEIPPTHLSPEELAITKLEAIDIVAGISRGQYTAIQVLDAFTHRAAIAHKLLNCCLEFRYQDARAEAEKLDQHYRKTGKTVGPLHGLPISVKDQCRIAGTETTCGFVYKVGVKDTEDCTLVKCLKEAGAVVFVKTNLSTGCLWGETINNVSGRTCNPYNRAFSCGGSSGGEAALIGIHGSPLGIGTDLGGSIRSPSAYQGLWGLRPSTGRIPYYRMMNSMEGNEIVESVVGPISRSPHALQLFTKAVLSSQPWLYDPKCHPIPWREGDVEGIVSGGRPLRIGVMPWDERMLPHPPIRRAIKEVEAKLKAAGHITVPWKLDQKMGFDLLMEAVTSDRRADVEKTMALSGEPPLDHAYNDSKEPLSLMESWDVATRHLNYRASVLEQWNATAKDGQGPIDAYISPLNPNVAIPHDDLKRVGYMGYTGTVNTLDFTACTIPVTFVDSQVDLADDPSGEFDATGQPLPPPVSDLDKTVRANYEPGRFKGLPVTVQLVCRKLEEEKVLAIAQVLHKLLN